MPEELSSEDGKSADFIRRLALDSKRCKNSTHGCQKCASISTVHVFSLLGRQSWMHVRAEKAVCARRAADPSDRQVLPCSSQHRGTQQLTIDLLRTRRMKICWFVFEYPSCPFISGALSSTNTQLQASSPCPLCIDPQKGNIKGQKNMGVQLLSDGRVTGSSASWPLPAALPCLPLELPCDGLQPLLPLPIHWRARSQRARLHRFLRVIFCR